MSIRTKMALGFAGVAAAAALLALGGLNAAMVWTMGHSMLHGVALHHLPGTPMGAAMAALWRWSVAAGLVAVGGAGLLGWWLAGRIAAPLVAVAHMAERAGLGDLSQRVEVPPVGDEVALLARSFNRMAERLEAADRARRQMLADLAHELRHPVSVIQAQLELFQDGVRPATPENLAALQDEVIRLGRLIGDLQDLSLAEAGALALDRRLLTAGDVVGPVAASLAPVAEGRGIQLTCQVDPGTPPILGDAQRLRQVLVNLVTNALRHTPAGGQVIIRAEPASGGGLALHVEDTGMGIDPADLPHIFDRFYRADRSRSRQTGGTGLGLAICKTLIELHGGRIAAVSQPGQGSRFTVWLPAAKQI